MPWQQSGIKAGRTWVIAPSKETLDERWHSLLQAVGEDRRPLFKDSPTGRKVHESSGDLPPVIGLANGSANPSSARFSFRTLDRQFVFSDPRLLDRPGPSLWLSQGNKQIYLLGLFSEPLGPGPALAVSAEIPDLHYFRGRGGKDVLPLYRDADATHPNILPCLLEMLGNTYDRDVAALDLAAYLYGILAHPGYTNRYYEELDTREVRVPLTKQAELFERVRSAGARLLWLQTYGQRYVPSGEPKGHVPTGAAKNTVSVPQDEEGFPTSYSYDEGTQTLHVGKGQVAPVAKEVYEFEVSGLKVVQSWLRYRMRHGAGKKSSPLDEIRPTKWPAAFTIELLELLWVLDATVAGYQEQAALLEAIVTGECFTATELPEVPSGMRQAPKPPPAGSLLV